VFVDIDPVSFNLDPELVEQSITPRTKAILPVHVFGRPVDMRAILDLARRHNLFVIEDACEALGARWGGRMVGTFGHAGVFAFYPNKQMTTGEGGMIVTDDPSLDQLFKSLRSQGRADPANWLQHERLGYNYRLSDINCALGVSQLSRISEILRRRREVAEEYRRQLSDLDELELPLYEMAGGDISWFVYVVRVKGFDRPERDALLAYLRREGVACSNYFSPLHLLPHIKELGFDEGDFPVTEAVGASTVALPFFNALTSQDISRVARALRRGLRIVHGSQTPHPLHRSVL
jgi:perosamine synthetase